MRGPSVSAAMLWLKEIGSSLECSDVLLDPELSLGVF